jgi:hypothetical protein
MYPADPKDSTPTAWWVTVLLNVVGAAVCFGCVTGYYRPSQPAAGQPLNDSNRESAARAAASEHFQTLSRPTPENAAAWGGTAFAVVGQYWPMDRSVVGPMRVERPDPNAAEYRAALPCCVRVRDGGGERVEVREIGYRLTPDGDRYAVAEWSFTSARPFGPSDRFASWFKRTLLIPLQCLLAVVVVGFVLGLYMALSSLFQGEFQATLLWPFAMPLYLAYLSLLGMRLFGVVNSAYLAYVCWGSALAVFVAFAVTAVLVTLLFRWLGPHLEAAAKRLDKKNEPPPRYHYGY